MVGSTSLEVHYSIFNITEENNKFKHFELSDLRNVEGIYESARVDVQQKS